MLNWLVQRIPPAAQTPWLLRVLQTIPAIWAHGLALNVYEITWCSLEEMARSQSNSFLFCFNVHVVRSALAICSSCSTTDINVAMGIGHYGYRIIEWMAWLLVQQMLPPAEPKWSANGITSIIIITMEKYFLQRHIQSHGWVVVCVQHYHEQFIIGPVRPKRNTIWILIFECVTWS